MNCRYIMDIKVFLIINQTSGNIKKSFYDIITIYYEKIHIIN